MEKLVFLFFICLTAASCRTTPSITIDQSRYSVAAVKVPRNARSFSAKLVQEGEKRLYTFELYPRVDVPGVTPTGAVSGGKQGGDQSFEFNIDRSAMKSRKANFPVQVMHVYQNGKTSEPFILNLKVRFKK